MVNPAVNFPIRGTGEKAWFGWPCDKKLDELREAWFNATEAAASEEGRRRDAAARLRAVPYHPDRRSSSCRPPTARRSRALIIAPIDLALERREEVTSRARPPGAHDSCYVCPAAARRDPRRDGGGGVGRLLLLYLTPGDPAALIAGDLGDQRRHRAASAPSSGSTSRSWCSSAAGWGARCTAISAPRSSPTCR